MSSPRVAHLEAFREYIEREYRSRPTGCGGSFDEILCFELHNGDRSEFLAYTASVERNGVHAGCDFKALAKKWEIPVAFLGQLVSQHCERLGDDD